MRRRDRLHDELEELELTTARLRAKSEDLEAMMQITNSYIHELHEAVGCVLGACSQLRQNSCGCSCKHEGGD